MGIVVLLDVSGLERPLHNLDCGTHFMDTYASANDAVWEELRGNSTDRIPRVGCSLLTLVNVLYDLGLNTQYIILDWTTSLIGIAFSLIIYRLATTSSNSTSTSGVSSRPAGPNSSYPLTSVNVSRIVEVTQDSDKVYAPERSMDNKPAHGESWVAM
ncbi:hypothetical protein R3P38DRAFT_3184468 [Favolaschia claudopus]|uniref:Uncharacterized protein n=1 Tax=Favolaschia claudopus TaxID=2862362 RepID=A0AAW0C6Q1_9AGAR